MQLFTLVLLAATIVGVTANVHCFQCTSNDNEACAVNDEASLKAFNKVCGPNTFGDEKSKNAIGCRKILQNVEGVESTVRECAYSGENVDGLKKSGNHAVKLFYYQCTNEKAATPCNSVPTTFSAISIFSAILAFYLLQ